MRDIFDVPPSDFIIKFFLKDPEALPEHITPFIPPSDIWLYPGVSGGILIIPLTP